jgi:hypothetical protein
MKSKQLTLGEISLIYTEIVGNQNVQLKGLMNYEMKMSLKFKLHTLAKALEPHFQFVQEQNKKFLESHGGQIDQTSPEFQEFINKINEMMEIEHEINIPELSIEDFEDIKTNEYPANLFNLIS